MFKRNVQNVVQALETIVKNLDEVQEFQLNKASAEETKYINAKNAMAAANDEAQRAERIADKLAEILE